MNKVIVSTLVFLLGSSLGFSQNMQRECEWHFSDKQDATSKLSNLVDESSALLSVVEETIALNEGRASADQLKKAKDAQEYFVRIKDQASTYYTQVRVSKRPRTVHAAGVSLDILIGGAEVHVPAITSLPLQLEAVEYENAGKLILVNPFIAAAVKLKNANEIFKVSFGVAFKRECK